MAESAIRSQPTFKDLLLEDRIKNRPGGNYLEYDSGIPPELAVKPAAMVKRREYRCECCGVVDYNNKPLKLVLFHIDGNDQNFDHSNTKLLCPNCVSQQ